ncbi:MAG: hypothetical protein FWC41_12170 [Firmicutes bacterium]|nr:hypothetical protein [Bacillota bacterium]
MKRNFKLICFLIAIFMMLSLIPSTVLAIDDAVTDNGIYSVCGENCTGNMHDDEDREEKTRYPNCIPLLNIHDPVPVGEPYKTGPDATYCWNLMKSVACLGCGKPLNPMLWENGPVHSWTMPVGGWQACRNCGMNRPAP